MKPLQYFILRRNVSKFEEHVFVKHKSNATRKGLNHNIKVEEVTKLTNTGFFPFWLCVELQNTSRLVGDALSWP